MKMEIEAIVDGEMSVDGKGQGQGMIQLRPHRTISFETDEGKSIKIEEPEEIWALRLSGFQIWINDPEIRKEIKLGQKFTVKISNEQSTLVGHVNGTLDAV